MAKVSRAETVRMLDGVPLFSGLTKKQLTAVAKLVTMRVLSLVHSSSRRWKSESASSSFERALLG